MEEYTNAVNAESAPAADSEITQIEKEPASEPIEANTAEDVTEDVPVTDGEEPQEGKKVPAAEKRIKQLLSRQKQALEQAQIAKQEAQYWKARVQGGASQDVPEAPREPHIDDFEAYEDFLVAKTRHEIFESQKRETIQREQERIDHDFIGRIDKAAVNNPDIYSVLNDASLPVSAAMGLVIKNSENAPDLLLYLNDHRDEALKMARLDPLLAIKEIGKLEVKLSNANKPEPVRKVSLAPEPIKPLEATGSPTVNLEKISMDEYMRTRNKGMVTGKIKRK